MTKLIFIVFIILSITSCGKKELAEPEYISWVKDVDNGLFSSREMSDFNFELFYSPKEYQALIAGVKGVNKEDDVQSYILKITSKHGEDVLRTGITDEAEYNNRLFYLMDYIHEDFKIIQGNDTLPCLFSHYERNYGLAPYAKVILQFSETDSEINNDKLISYNDRIFGTGPINFLFESDALKNIPNLKN